MSKTLVLSSNLSVWRGAEVTKQETQATLNYYDGRSEVITVKTYLVQIKLPSNVGDLWSDAELKAVGLEHVVDFVYPDGKHPVGEPRYMRQTDTGKVLEIYDLEDDLPQEPSVEERVAGIEQTQIDLQKQIDELSKTKTVEVSGAVEATKP